MAREVKRKRCVWDGGPLNQKTATQWVCGTCGLPYGVVLMTDKEAWKEFRRRARRAIEAERMQAQPGDDLRPMIGVTLAHVVEGMAGWRAQ